MSSVYIFYVIACFFSLAEESCRP